MSDEQEHGPIDGWGQPISAKRKEELQRYLDQWEAETDHGVRRGPFASGRRGEYGVKLTGADVYWLARQHENYAGRVPTLHLEGADLLGARLERCKLADAHLEGAYLGNDTSGTRTHLKWADLRGAHLEGVNLAGADLRIADLRGAWFDSTTVLSGAILDSQTRLGDIQWGGVGAVNLTTIDWNTLTTIGDEYVTGKGARVEAYERVVRAYRQIAAQLRAQGISEVADRYLYRAQRFNRGIQFRQGRIFQYVGSWSLALLAGYGYRPGRTIVAYLAIIAAFTWLYMQATTGWVPFGLPNPSSLAPLPWYEALILSVSSFHGRGFFQPLQSLGDPVAALAAIEAVVGLFIEISFIATFTQRYFANR